MREYKYLLVREEGAHLEIRLNRPEKRNALNDGLVTELKDVFSFYKEEGKIKTVSLKGEGKAFCSGADLAHLKKMRNFNREENLKDSLSLARLYLLIYQYPKPVIAVVDGAALAGGSGLASVCDFVLAGDEAKFGYPEVRIGFIAALVSAFLIRQSGERRARELLLTGKIISADEAKEYGLINSVYAKDELLDAEKNLINQLHNNSAFAMESSKKLFTAHIEEEIEQLARRNAAFRESDDFMEGISSFIEKRKPKWSEKT